MDRKQYNIVSRLMEEARSVFVDEYGSYESIPEKELNEIINMFNVAIVVSRKRYADRRTILRSVYMMCLDMNGTKVKEYIDNYIDYQEEESDETQLKPFQRVLTRDRDNDIWHINIFEHYSPLRQGYRCIRNTWLQCVPYNEETRHLLGTRKSAPEKYNNQLTQRQENKDTE